MLKKKLRGKSKFLRKMNELMEIYSRNQDTAFAYRELLGLEPLIKYEGERAMFDLNRASLLYGKIPRSGKCASPHSVHQSDV